MMKLGTFVDVSYVINHANFHLRTISSPGAGGGQKGGFAFEMHMALTTLPCASLASDWTIEFMVRNWK
jgi:hypothetical protein